MVSYCSTSNNRSLTKCLIESSNNSSQYFHRFVNISEWSDGLDLWSLSETIRKNPISQHSLDFHHDIGLYLPRYERDNIPEISLENELIYSKRIINNYLPERLRKLFKKEKNLLIEDHSNISSSDEQLSSIEDNEFSTSIQQLKSIEIPSNKVRLSLRPVQCQNYLQEKQSKQIQQQNYPSFNREKLKSLLKEQLTSLFTRETTNINHKRTLIRIPLVEIKHRNLPPKTTPIIDPTLIMERYNKLQQLLISRTPSQATINNKLMNNHQPPLGYDEMSTFGLNVTPIGFSCSKSFESSFLETKFEQENSSLKTRRSTQQVSFRCSIDKNDDEQRIISKGNIESGFIASSGNFVLSNKNSNDEQTQTIRKFYRHHRSSSKNRIQRSKTFDLLPALVSGKRLHIPIPNQRNS
ncbi:unnamed protein product [Rotaria sordida]|uniref:Uncharacterized protein n=1 Tax=Rotaria sordida TaxID=392033 RepID=A0A819XMA2_9BILA|nr:unnamed protein product [Rotaria sordida]